MKRQLRHQHLQRVVLHTELLDFIRACFPDGVSVELSFSGLEERLAPLVVHRKVDAFLPAEVINVRFSSQSLEDNPDLFLSCELTAGLAFDVPDNRLGRGPFHSCHSSLLTWFFDWEP